MVVRRTEVDPSANNLIVVVIIFFMFLALHLSWTYASEMNLTAPLVECREETISPVSPSTSTTRP